MSSGNIYNIDYKRLTVLLLPTFLRKPVMYSFLQAFLKPIVSIHTLFMAARASHLYRIAHTPQVYSLRALLNDAFDPDLRRIMVTDGATNDWLMVYPAALFTPEGGKNPIWLRQKDDFATNSFGGKTIIFDTQSVALVPRQGAINTAGNDFMVELPMELRGTIDEQRVVSLVNTYKLFSKRYEIKYYTV